MLWLVVGLVAVVGVAALTGKKQVQTEIVVPAPPDAVWAALIDGDQYGAWHPVLVAVQGRHAEGATVRYQMADPGSGKVSEVSATVVRFEPGKALEQTGGVPGVLTFHHHWHLEPTAGGTRVRQFEIYRGAWVWFWDPAPLEPAYTRANQNLRARLSKE